MNIEKVIVFIHRGNSWYLPYTLWQCKATNPGATIYFIGDKQTTHFPKWVEHIDIEAYKEAGNELRKVYNHKSNLGAEFELMCIERWFILSAFMTAHNIDKCIYLDSDILVYKDLSKQYALFPPHDMTWCSFSAHSNYIFSVAALNDYCRNVIDCYTNNFPAEKLAQSLYHSVMSGKANMNISDMTFFHDYNIRYPNSLLVVSNPNPLGTFDISMEEIRVFEDDGEGFKKVIWKDKLPYCIERTSGIEYPFVTLHFQGRGKEILKKNFRCNSLQFQLHNFTNYLHLLVNKLMKKFIKR